jgi:RNA polymerase sigma factor (sigma-70 family)
MVHATLDAVVARARRLTLPPAGQGRPDGELLADFLEGNDQPAFEAIVRRHGPMVLGLCRRVLGNAEDAEDAFQATFLVLARRAGAIRKRGSLASWLYGVAFRMATNARKTAARRRKHEKRAAVTSAAVAPDSSPADWQAVLDEEVRNLPEAYREAFVLCCLEQVTSAEAARRLGRKEGTVCSRLARARKLLRERLARRGVSLSALLAATALAGPAARAAVPARLLAATVQVAGHLAAGGRLSGELVSAGVLALVESAGRKATSAMMGTALVVFLMTAFAVAGMAPANPGVGARAVRRAPRPEGKEAPVAGEVQVTGKVLDAAGKPVAGAKLLVWTKGVGGRANMPTRARSGDDGAFRFDLREDEVFSGARVIAEGRSGVDWAVVANAMQGCDLTLRLRPDDIPLTGRILDLEGRPVAGVTLEILSVGQTAGDVGRWVDRFVDAWKKGSWVGWSGLTSAPPEALGLKPPVTDKDGRFVLKGVGRNRVVTLLTRGERNEAMQFQMVARAGPNAGWKSGYLGLYPAGGEIVVGPTKPIVGTIRDRKTGKPAPGVTVACVTQRSKAMETTTDENGRYRITGSPKQKSYTISLGGKKGYPYLDYTHFDVPDTEGLVPLVVDLTVERGVEITGRVLARDGRRPVRGHVGYTELPDNPHVKNFPTLQGFKHLVSDWGRVEADGSFRVVGIPGRGVLVVAADEKLRFAQVDPYREFVVKHKLQGMREAHAVIPVDPPANRPRPADVGDILLEPAAEVTGRVVDPDGKPLPGAAVAGLRDRSGLVDAPPLRDAESGSVKVLKGATFTARSRRPGEKTALIFYHPEKKLARIVSPEAAPGKVLEVRLQRCGTVTGRVVDEKGRPLSRVAVYLQTQTTTEELEKRDLPVYDLTTGFYRVIHRKLKTDADGKFRAEGLVPGWPYHLFAVEADGDGIVHLIKSLEFKPGEVRDLGDLKRNIHPPKDEE